MDNSQPTDPFSSPASTLEQPAAPFAPELAESAGSVPLSAVVAPERSLTWLRVPGIWASLGWIVLMLIAQNVAAIVVLVPAVLLGYSVDEMTSVLLPVSAATLLMFALVVTTLIFRSQWAQVLALRRITLSQAMVVCLLQPPLAIIGTEISSMAAQVLPSYTKQVLLDFSQMPLLLVLIGGCLLPAVGEEVMFRGFLGRGLVARYGLVGGTLLSAVMFSAMHIDPVQASGVLVLGIALQGVYIATRSLLAPVLLHGVNNSVAFAFVAMDPASLDAIHLPWLVVGTAALGLSALTVLMYEMRSSWICPDGISWTPGFVTAEAPPAGVSARCCVRRPAIKWVVLTAIAYVAFVTAIIWEADAVF